MPRFKRWFVSLLPALLAQLFVCTSCVAADPVHLVDQPPVAITELGPRAVLVDFGRAAFGNLKLSPPTGASGTLTVRFGEKLREGRIDTKPPGTVRYQVVTVELKDGQEMVVAPPADARNTEQISEKHPPAVLTPKAWGVVLPFRWVEIEDWPGKLTRDQIVRRAAFAVSWDDEAASFESSDEVLNRIWELCRYSIKATTFAGVYVDGDRERIPYEADAYLNQLSHYYTDNDSQMARDTYDWLMKHGTWPTEWAPHMVFMAHAEWMRTGDKKWLETRYEALKDKMLLERAGPDGLITSDQQQQKRTDIVDWPKGERDGYVFTEINTVVNAFHLAALHRMTHLAQALGKDGDVMNYESRAKRTHKAFQRRLFDTESGLYRDGIGTKHSSQHANFFPIAFGLVPEDDRQGVINWLKGRGMHCSVYAAQYLLEGLFQNGGDEKALELILADTDRSWKHMLESGTTITWEAWDQKYKPNQDWNHAWGAAPANLLPRFVLGVEPLEAGWQRARIRPCPSGLARARGKVPTPNGPILIDWKRGASFELSVTLPNGVPAKVELPAPKSSTLVYVNGTKVDARREGSRWILAEDVSGTVNIEVK